jgi:hypothetical protein
MLVLALSPLILTVACKPLQTTTITMTGANNVDEPTLRQCPFDFGDSW